MRKPTLIILFSLLSLALWAAGSTRVIKAALDNILELSTTGTGHVQIKTGGATVLDVTDQGNVVVTGDLSSTGDLSGLGRTFKNTSEAGETFAIGNGYAVKNINYGGTMKAYKSFASWTPAQPTGLTGVTSPGCLAYDQASKKVVVFQTTSANSLDAAVGNLEGRAITWGTTAQVDADARDYTVLHKTCLFINGHVVVMYMDHSEGYHYAIAGTISGTVITWGTRVKINTAFNPSVTTVSALPGDTTMIFHVHNAASTVDLTAATVAAGVITLGSVVVKTGTIDPYTYDGSVVIPLDDNEFALAYINGAATDNGEIQHAAVSGTAITLNASGGVTWSSDQLNRYLSWCVDTRTKDVYLVADSDTQGQHEAAIFYMDGATQPFKSNGGATQDVGNQTVYNFNARLLYQEGDSCILIQDNRGAALGDTWSHYTEFSSKVEYFSRQTVLDSVTVSGGSSLGERHWGAIGSAPHPVGYLHDEGAVLSVDGKTGAFNDFYVVNNNNLAFVEGPTAEITAGATVNLKYSGDVLSGAPTGVVGEPAYRNDTTGAVQATKARFIIGKYITSTDILLEY